MSKKQKQILVLASAFALTFGIVPTVSAMHIMEGYVIFREAFALHGGSYVFHSSLPVLCPLRKL